MGQTFGKKTKYIVVILCDYLRHNTTKNGIQIGFNANKLPRPILLPLRVNSSDLRPSPTSPHLSIQSAAPNSVITTSIPQSQSSCDCKILILKLISFI